MAQDKGWSPPVSPSHDSMVKKADELVALGVSRTMFDYFKEEGRQGRGEFAGLNRAQLGALTELYEQARERAGHPTYPDGTPAVGNCPAWF